MRQRDLGKRADQKAAKTVNFDVPVLDAIEAHAKRQGTTVSHIVNWACIEKVMSKARYYNDMVLYHEEQAAKYAFLRDKEMERKQFEIAVKMTTTEDDKIEYLKGFK